MAYHVGQVHTLMNTLVHKLVHKLVHNGSSEGKAESTPRARYQNTGTKH